MARFASTMKSINDALNLLADLANALGQRTYTAVTTSSATVLAALMVNAIYRISGGSTFAFTTDTAANIVAAIPNCQVGSAFSLEIINNNSGTMTITAGSGVTLVGTTTALTGTTRFYRGIVTNATAGAEAVSLYGLMTGTV